MWVLLAVRAHYWTIVPWLKERLRPVRPQLGIVPWSSLIDDAHAGPVRIRGELQASAEGKRAVVLVHGLGGGYDSFYCRAAARKIRAHGWTVLNLALRGADLECTDYYHGGLTTDVHRAIDVLAAEHEAVHVLGFSVGGHIALHVASESREPKLRSIAAIGAPLDLASACAHFDSRRATLYRRHVLNGCKLVYASVAARASVPTPLSQVLAARKMREMDLLTIVPRFGFASASDYYASCSVARHLPGLNLPALYIGAVQDPLVPEAVVRPFLPGAPGALTVHLVQHGGHLGFPKSLNFGYSPRPGLVHQVLGWFERQ